MNRKIKTHPTELDEYDKKVLEKYTVFHTNMIESNTAKTGLFNSNKEKTM